MYGNGEEKVVRQGGEEAGSVQALCNVCGMATGLGIVSVTCHTLKLATTKLKKDRYGAFQEQGH